MYNTVNRNDAVWFIHTIHCIFQSFYVH